MMMHGLANFKLPVEFTTGRLHCLLCTLKWKGLRSEGYWYIFKQIRSIHCRNCRTAVNIRI